MPTLCYAVVYNDVNIIYHNIVLDDAAHCNAMTYYAMLYYAMPYYAMPCHTIPCYNRLAPGRKPQSPGPGLGSWL